MARPAPKRKRLRPEPPSMAQIMAEARAACLRRKRSFCVGGERFVLWFGLVLVGIARPRGRPFVYFVD